MLITPIILFVILKLRTCRCAASQGAELYFRLLQTDGQSTDFARALRFPLNVGVGKKDIRRPKPSDDLPVDILIEDKSPLYDPREEDMKFRSLRKQLGQNYDKDFMSVYDPTRSAKIDSRLISFVHGRPRSRRPAFLRRLRTARIQDGQRIKLKASKRERRKFQKYIWSLTFCPVKYSWKYLGIRFWPKWIKEGSCTKKRSCSVPEGMKCKPSSSTNKTFLRWRCEDYASRKGCGWIPILYPIVTECSCSC